MAQGPNTSSCREVAVKGMSKETFHSNVTSPSALCNQYTQHLWTTLSNALMVIQWNMAQSDSSERVISLYSSSAHDETHLDFLQEAALLQKPVEKLHHCTRCCGYPGVLPVCLFVPHRRGTLFFPGASRWTHKLGHITFPGRTLIAQVIVIRAAAKWAYACVRDQVQLISIACLATCHAHLYRNFWCCDGQVGSCVWLHRP